MKDFEEILDTYYQKIFSFCLQRVGNIAEAEDLTQECFTKAYKNIHNLKDTSLLKNWLYTIANNLCHDSHRSIGKFKNFLRGLIIHNDNVIIDSQHLVLKLVRKLPQQQAEVFILRQFHDFSTEETAKMLGIAEGTVKSQLSRAVNFLKSELQKTGYFDN